MNSGTITNQLLDAVQVLVDDAVKKAEFDRTVQAVISKCVSATKGQYSVKYQGGFFYAYAQDPSITYTPETQVYVLIPGNDMNKTKTILGTVEKLGENFVSEAESSIFENVGNNICSDNEETVYGLHSYYITDNIVLYERGTTPSTDFAIDEEAANLYLKNSDYLMIAAKFRTNLPQEHRTKGNYGLKYTLTFIDPITGENIDRSYILDINHMLGNPYAQAVSMRQVLPFEIDADNFQYIKKIEIFSKDFTTVADASKPADIFISDIELNGALMIAADEGTGYILSLITKQGVYFKENDDLSSTRHIEAELYKDGEKQNITSNDVIYYWFKEDDSIYYNSPGFLKYGGQGWKCINEPTLDGKFLPGQSYIDVSKLDNPAKENNYKCVVVFKNTTLYMDREITIYNQSSNYTVTLSSDVSDLSDAATAHLTCEVTGTLPGHSISYSWSKIVDNRLPAEFISETNEPTLEVDLREAIKNIVYKCTAKDSSEDIYLGSDSVAITRGSEETAGYYYISIINDNQIFKYDTHGNSPADISLINPQIINPLSFTLYDPDGQIVNYEDIGASNINWVIPNEDTSMIINAEPMSSYNEKLGFEIRNKYDINAIDNTIEIEVFYDNKTIRGKANLLFLKEGENGSNGTSYFLNVVPNYSGDNAPDGRVFYYYRDANNQGFNFTPVENKFPFRTLFYRDGDIIYDSSRNQDNIEATVTYDFVKRIYFTDKNRRPYVTYSDESRFEINENNINYIDTTLGDQAGEYSADILRCTFEYDGLVWYYYYPIIFVKYDAAAADCEVVIPKTSGFTEVIYTEDGRNPQYKGNTTFNIDVYRNYEKISSEIDWAVQGQIFTSEWQEEANLIAENENEFKAKEAYNGNCVTNALYGEVTDGTNTIAEIHFPIAMYLNTYANEFINEWNGNAIELNEEGGIILTPQIAAGQKEQDNTFTGVVGGKAKEATSDTIEQGIFGYNHGERTFELNAEDGSAKFGKAGAGQIVISPDEDSAHSVLQSGNYVAPVLSPSGDVVTPGEGLQIDLTEPSLTFGSGLFRVDKNGNVYASQYATVSNLAAGNVPVGRNAIDGLSDVMDAVTVFQVDLDKDSYNIPCDSSQKTTNGQTYIINALLTYAGQLITSYDINNLTITSELPTSAIDYTKTFANGVLTITFTTKGTTISSLSNNYTCEFYYPVSQETVTKKITLTLAPKGAAGETGPAGGDAYTIVLSNESHTFAATDTAAIGESIIVTPYIYKGATQQTEYTIGTIGGTVTGLTATVGNTNPKTITITSTTALVTQNGVLTIPITIDGKTFNKQFSWSLAKAGSDGESGISYYTYVRYSENSDGTDFNVNPSPSRIYMGVYTGTSDIAPTDKGAYKWSKYIGDNGNDGNGIDSITYYYKTTTTQTAPAAADITDTTIPTLSATNKYLWQKEIIHYTNTEKADKVSVLLLAAYGDQGNPGVNGTSPTAYNLVVSHAAIVKTKSNTYSPASITFNATSQTGDGAITTYTDGSYRITKDNGTAGAWTNLSSSNTYNVTNAAPATSIKIELSKENASSSTHAIIDTQTLPIVMDGVDGTSPYTSYLTNEVQTFAYGTTATVKTNLYAYLGATEKNVQIKTVNGVTASTSSTATGLTGMNFLVNSIDSVAHPEISFISTTSLPQTQTVQVPIVYRIAGESVDRTVIFSYATTTRGATGTAAKQVIINPSSQMFKSTTGATGIFNPQYIYLYPSFQSCSYSKWQYSTDGTTWVDVTSGSNSLTIGTYSSIANSLRIERTCNLYTDLITAISFKCISNDNTIYDTITIVKIYDVTDIQIGGRNLALDTKKLTHNSDYNNRYVGTYSSGVTTVSRQDEFVEARCFNQFRGLGVYLNDMNLQVGDVVNLQAMVRNENVMDNFIISLYLMEHNASGTRVYINTPLSVLGGSSITNNSVTLGNINIGEIKKVSVAITWNQDLQDLIDAGGKVNATIQTNRSFTGTETSYIAMWALKLEKGNILTDWTPAPEDVDEDIFTLGENVSDLGERASDLESETRLLNEFKADQDILNRDFRSDIDTNFDTSVIKSYILYKEIPYTYSDQPIAVGSQYDSNLIYYKDNEGIKQKIDALDILDYFPMPTDGNNRTLRSGAADLYTKVIPAAPQQLIDGDDEAALGWSETKNAWQDNIAVYSCVAVEFGDNHKQYSIPVLVSDYQSIEDMRYKQGNEVLLNTKGYTRVFWKDQDGIFVYDSDTEASSLRRIVINSKGINYATRTSFHATTDKSRDLSKSYYEQDEKIPSVYYLVSDWSSRKTDDGTYTMENLFEEDLHRYAQYADFPDSGVENNYYYARLENKFYKYTNSNGYIEMSDTQVINQFPAWETSSVWGIEGTMNLKRMDVNYLRANEIADGVLTLGSSAADGKLIIQNDELHENFKLGSERFECALYNNSQDIIGYIYIGQDIGLQCVSIDGTVRYGNNLTWTVASGKYQNNVNYYTSQNLTSLKTDVVIGDDIGSGIYTCSCDKIFNLTNEKVYEDITFMSDQTEVIKTQTLVFDEVVNSETLHHKGIGFIIG